MKTRFASVIIALSFLSAGCQSQSPKVETPTTIKVLAWNEQQFNQQYAVPFLAANSNIDVEVLSIAGSLKPGEDLNEAIDKLVIQQNPDVLVLPMDFYTVQKEKDRLSSLTPLIKRDDFDLEGYAPAVKNFLTDEQQQMYGLTPTFTGRALYYNKKLFNAAGIGQPADFMTWEEVFQLAGRFPGTAGNSKPVYGFYEEVLGNPFYMALKIGEGSGLTFYQNRKFTLHTDEWLNLFGQVTECVKTQACYDTSKRQPQDVRNIEQAAVSRHPFLAGDIAMAVDDSELYKLLTASSGRYPDLDWGVVTLPVSTQHPDTGSGIGMNEVFSINRNSEHTDAAWELIAYVCGDAYARLLPRLNPNDLPARTPGEAGTDSNLGAFYKLDHMKQTISYKLRKLPRPVINKMDEVLQTYAAEVFSERMELPEALQKMQDELQHAIDSNPEG